MIAGDTNQRNFTLPVPDPPKSSWYSDPDQSSQAGLRQKAIGFNCLNYAKAPEGSLYRHFLPDKAYLDANCADGVRFELMFPSCWNGKDITSKDHKSHVAYPDLVMTGTCPPGFETRLVSLFYEIIYQTNQFAGQDGQFIISNGDPTGYGYHGDFMMGWDEGFLQQAVDTCTNLSGMIQDCPLFTIQDSLAYSSCKFATPDVVKADITDGPVASLPGNVKIQAGPAYAVPGGGVKAAPSIPVVPSLGFSAGSSVTSGTYIPGAVFVASTSDSSAPTPAVAAQNAASVTIPTSAPAVQTPTTLVPVAAPATTPAPVAPVLLPGQSIVSTMYSTMGNEVLELVMLEEAVTVTAEVTATATVSTTTTMAMRKKRHLHRHNVHGRA